MGDIITNLNPANLIASTSNWVGPLFYEMLPWALAGLGIILAGLFVSFLINKIGDGIHSVFHIDKEEYIRKYGINTKEDFDATFGKYRK